MELMEVINKWKGIANANKCAMEDLTLNGYRREFSYGVYLTIGEIVKDLEKISCGQVRG